MGKYPAEKIKKKEIKKIVEGQERLGIKREQVERTQTELDVCFFWLFGGGEKEQGTERKNDSTPNSPNIVTISLKLIRLRAKFHKLHIGSNRIFPAENLISKSQLLLQM